MVGLDPVAVAALDMNRGVEEVVDRQPSNHVAGAGDEQTTYLTGAGAVDFNQRRAGVPGLRLAVDDDWIVTFGSADCSAMR